MENRDRYVRYDKTHTLDLVQKSGGLGSVPQPQEPLVKSLYQVVEAHGSPLYIGGHPSHIESSGSVE